MFLRFCPITLFAVGMLSSCLPTNSDSTTRALRPGIDLGGSKNFRDMVIFYANETPDTALVRGYYQKIDSIVASLNSTEPNSVYDRIRSGYQNDLAQFPAQVRKDVLGLKKVICDEKRFKSSGLFIFTNELARAGQFEYCLPGIEGVQKGSITIRIPAAHRDDFRYTQSPLALPASLDAMRDAITQELESREMPLTDQRFVWISKSHGSSDLLITPKLLHRVDQLGDAGLRAYFKGLAGRTSFGEIRPASLTVGATMLGDLKLGARSLKDVVVGGDLKFSDLKFSDLKFSDLKVGDLKFSDLKLGDLKLGDLKSGDLKVGDLKTGDLKVGDLKLGDLKYGDLKVGDLKVGDLKLGDLKAGDLKEGDLASDEIPSNKDLIGITKTTFVEMIKKINLPFPVIFFESCSSQLSESTIIELKQLTQRGNSSSKIGRIYTSDRGGLKFETVRYSDLKPVDEFLSFGASLEAALDAAASGN